MKLIVGLGNPGESYQDTRHNIGFMVVDKLAREIGRTTLEWKTDPVHKFQIASVGDIFLLKPQTFMNKSGDAVKFVCKKHNIDSSDVWVVHDDIDLPIGKIRIREQGGTAGHNGVDSIIESLKTDKFVRFRLGIGRGREDIKKHTDQNLRHRSVIDFVLSRFTQSEAGALRKLIKYGVQAVRLTLSQGIDKAMNRFN